MPNEPLKPYRERMAALALETVRNDNEENAVLALKVLATLHKAYKGQLEEFVQPSFQLVVDMYRVRAAACVRLISIHTRPTTTNQPTN